VIAKARRLDNISERRTRSEAITTHSADKRRDPASYLETPSQIDPNVMKAQLQYWYRFERPHRTSSDRWGCAFADPRVIQSAAEFANERKRVVEIFRTGLATSWDADVVYHPPGHASAMYGWSSTEGAAHHWRAHGHTR